MTSDAPKFWTKSSTPLSPLPLHPQEPSHIPVLQNQIDPVFNMTSTHLASASSLTSQITAAATNSLINSDAIASNGEVDAVDDSSFSDPYEDDQEVEEGDASSKAPMNNTEADDDYAMTFDSDGEEGSDKQDVPDAANTDPDPQPTPVSVPLAEFLPVAAEPAQPITDKKSPAPSSQTLSPAANTPGDAAKSISGTAPMSNDTAPPQAQAHSYEGVANGEIDIQQLLDNITATAELNAANASSPTFPPGTGGFPSHASLPPRPQVVQTTPNIPGYSIPDDMRMYHAGPPGYPPLPLSSYRPPGVPGSLVAAGAPGTSTDPRNMLPPPPSASFHPPPNLTAPPPPPMGHVLQPQQHVLPPDRSAISTDSVDRNDVGEIQWSPNIQKLYDEFLADERMYVSEGLWDRFPVGSRLFIGNLPTEKVTKRDIFYAFYKYGKLAQVSIKQAYGFVQFHDAAACYNALQREQGKEIRGRTMHLEISKPQKNTRGSGGAAPAASRRSRSPERQRNGRNAQASARGAGADRYDARASAAPRDDGLRGSARARDDYRPGRSPSPTRGNYRDRDEYPSARGRDYYDGREHRRSRSRSPYGRRDNARYRERSFSPRGREVDDDSELSIPRRNPQDVPEVQIILMDELDRNFIAWVEGELRARGLKTDVMFLGPRMPIAAVIRRQILEGVLAVAQLTRRSQESSRIPLQVFDRKGGANNVRFDEYQDLEPKIAAELVLRDKNAQIMAPPIQQQYGQPQYSAPQAYQQPATAAAPNLANLVGQLDNATLQKLLGTLNSAAPPQNAPPVDLASILGGLTQPQHQQQQQLHQQQQQQHQQQQLQHQQQQLQHQQQQQQYQQQQNQYAAQAAAPNLATLLGNGLQAQPQHQTQTQPQAQPQGQQSAQQVQNIMAQLARFRQ